MDHPGQTAYRLDRVDAAIIIEMRAEPRIGVLELSRRIGVARGTVQARLDKMTAAGVITGFGPDLDLRAIGYLVTAFATIETTMGQTQSVVGPLSEIPEVLEVHSVAGQGDLLVRLVARSNDHLMEVLEQVLAIPDVARTSTAIALAAQIPYRTAQLLAAESPTASPTVGM